MLDNWKQVNFEGIFTFSLPAALSEVPMQSIDSNTASWAGEGITVRIDFGLFSDPLTSFTGHPGYNVSNEKIGSHTARIIRFDREDKGHFVAAHFHDLTEGRDAPPKKLTIVIETSQETEVAIAEKIIRSIKFKGESS